MFPDDADNDFRGFEVMPSPFSENVSCIGELPVNYTSEYCQRAYFGGDDERVSCTTCDLKDENWICLTCYMPFCSRYKNGHSAKHFEETGHSIAVSLGDLSFWDYGMDCYLDCFNIEELHPVFRVLHMAKFGESACLPATGGSGSGSGIGSGGGFTLELGVKKERDDDGGPKKTER